MTMSQDGPGQPRRRRPPRPLDAARLEELALAYVARFATSAGRLEAYLARKLRERGWEDEGEAAPAALVERFVAKGWVDDAGWGRMRTSGLLSRGYGARRIAEALRAGGISEEIRDSLAPGEADRREAAAAYARRRRLGPHGPALPRDAALRARQREKQLAAMLRAGHDFAAAARIVDAASADEIARWVRDAAEDQDR